MFINGWKTLILSQFMACQYKFKINPKKRFIQTLEDPLLPELWSSENSLKEEFFRFLVA